MIDREDLRVSIMPDPIMKDFMMVRMIYYDLESGWKYGQNRLVPNEQIADKDATVAILEQMQHRIEEHVNDTTEEAQ